MVDVQGYYCQSEGHMQDMHFSSDPADQQKAALERYILLGGDYPDSEPARMTFLDLPAPEHLGCHRDEFFRFAEIPSSPEAYDEDVDEDDVESRTDYAGDRTEFRPVDGLEGVKEACAWRTDTDDQDRDSMDVDLWYSSRDPTGNYYQYMYSRCSAM